MSTAIVVRPGETDFDREERIQGALDLPLTSVGRRQTADLIEQLRRLKPRVLYASPSEPARTTAALIGEALGLPLRELEGLANIDQGLWQGMLLADLRRKHPRVFRQWQDSPESVCPPAGETCEMATARVERALRKPMRRSESFAIIVSEPLAAIVRSVLSGEDAPRIPGPPAGGGAVGTIEVIDDSLADTAVLALADTSADLR